MHYIILIMNGVLLMAHVALWIVEWILFGSAPPPPPPSFPVTPSATITAEASDEAPYAPVNDVRENGGIAARRSRGYRG